MELRYQLRKLILAAGALLLFALPSLGQVSPIPFIKPTWTNNSGQPCSGCQLFTYQAGTTTPLVTYSDSAGIVPNSNPVLLDATGRADVFLGASAYKFVLQSAGGITYWTEDNITSTSLALLNSNNVWTGTNTWQSTSTFNGPTNFNVGFTSSGPNTLNGGGSLSGTFSGSPTFSGIPFITGGMTFNVPWTSLVTTGTPPFAVNSTSQVLNLNASQLQGATWAAPVAIGSSIPAAGDFTALTAHTSLTTPNITLNGTTISAVQGTDSHLLSAGTFTGSAGSDICKDANGGATTVGCATTGISQIQYKLFTGCTIVAGSYNECITGTQTWGTPFASSSYALVCTPFGTVPDGGSKESYIIYWLTKTASNFTLTIQNNRGTTQVDAVEIDCIGIQ